MHRDDFDGPLDGSVWGVYNGPGNGHTGPRSAANTFVRNGVLVLRTQPVDGEWKGAGVSSARGGLAQTYGKWVIRARFERGYGVRAVALLWPATDDWPPEIDFYEIPAGQAEREGLLLTNHWRRSSGGRGMDRSWITGRFDEWHEVGVEWTPQAIVFTVDGEVVASTTQHVPQEPMWLALQTAQGVIADGIVPDERVTPKVDFLVDWVEIYRYDGPVRP